MGPPRPGARLVGGAGPEVNQDLADHRRLGDAGDDAHGASEEERSADDHDLRLRANRDLIWSDLDHLQR